MNIKEISISVEQEQSVSLDAKQEKNVDVGFEKREVVSEERAERAYYDYDFTFNQENGKLELKMIANNGKVKTIEVDLPTEELVKNVSFNESKKEITIEWQNGQKTIIPLEGLVDVYKADESTITLDNSTNTFKIKEEWINKNIVENLDKKEDKSNLKTLAYRDSLSKSDVGLDKVNNVAITEEQVAQIGTNKTDIATLNQKVGNLTGSFQFKGELGSIAELPTASSSNAGYVYIIGNLEYVSDGVKWIQLGDEGSFVLKTTYESHLQTQANKDNTQDEEIGNIKNNYARKEEIPTKLSELEQDVELGVSEEDVLEIINQIDLSIDPTTYVMTVSLKNKAGETISTDNIDLPLESMVISARYADGKLYLTTKNGSELEGIDISNIVSGLVPNTRKINGKPLSSDITIDVPTKTSELTNDSNFATTSQLFSKNYNDLTNKPTIPTKVSELDNDKNYLTSFTETDPTVPSHIKNITTTDITNWNNKSTFSGNYNDLTNKPNLLTKDDVVNLTDNQTISGVKTFNETPLAKIRGSKLPIEYQEVEYIESTGTQYIDTGIIGKYGISSYCKINVTSNASDNAVLLGSRRDTGDTRYYIGYRQYLSNITFGYETEFTSTSKPVPNTIKEYEYICKNNTMEIKEDGITTITRSISYSFSTNRELYVFANNYSGVFNNPISCKLYALKMYDEDTLVRNFVPCYRKKDNVIGMYDIVSNTFFTNKGSGVFEVGNDINLDTDKEVKLATIEEIPTSTSQLENNSGFVTEEFVNNQVSTIPKMDIVVVSSLPTSGIKTKTIYLVNTSTEQGNLYEEYLYINDKWELLGSAKVDLSGYANLNSENSFAKTQTVIGNDDTTLVLKAKHSSWSNIALFNNTGKRLGNIGANGIKPYWWGGEGQNDQIALLGDLAGYAQTTNLKTINGESIVGTGDITIESGSSEIPEVEVASDVTSVNIVPNVYYNVLSRENDLTLVMGGKKAGIFNEYSGQIQVDETPVTVQFTEKIRWNENGEVTKEDSSLKLNGKNTYLFSIVNGIGLITNVANEELDTPTINIVDGMFEFGYTPNAELYVIKAPNGDVLYSTTLTFDPMPLSMFDETLGIGEHILTVEAQSSKYTDSRTTFTYIVTGKLSAPTNLVLSTINMLSWDSVEKATDYTITLVETGNTLTATNNMYNVETLLQGLEAGTYHLTVTANGDGKIYLTSEPSAPLEVVITGA